MSISESRIAELEKIGFVRWTKAGKDRLYIKASYLGLECLYYNTGNIKYAEFDGYQISNSQAYRYKAAKTYIDIPTGTVHSDYDDLKEAAMKLSGLCTDA